MVEPKRSKIWIQRSKGLLTRFLILLPVSINSGAELDDAVAGGELSTSGMGSGEGTASATADACPFFSSVSTFFSAQ